MGAPEGTVDEAVEIANGIEQVLDGKRASASLLAMGWVLGAFAAKQASPKGALRTIMKNVTENAELRCEGVISGEWP